MGLAELRTLIDEHGPLAAHQLPISVKQKVDLKYKYGSWNRILKLAQELEVPEEKVPEQEPSKGDE